MIGLYFARRVSFNKNKSLVVKEKFFGIDLTKPTINMQLFATDKQPDPNVITLANKYGKSSDVIRGSLRVPVTDAQANQIIDDFINLVK